MKTSYLLKDIFSIAIAAEAKGVLLYEEFGRIFSHVPEAAELWKAMADDERIHEQKLRAIYETISEEQRHTYIDNPMVERTEKLVAGLSVPGIIRSVTSLDDAYETAYSLEHSEINAVMHFILTELVPWDMRYDFTSSMVGEHMERLEAFSQSVFNAERRRAISAVK